MNFKSFLYLCYLVVFIIFLLTIFSLLQIYQRFNDLNSSIITGANLAIKNGLLLSDIRGSVKDIADSYVNSSVMSSSFLYNNINKVVISSYDVDKCYHENKIFNINESKYTNVGIIFAKEKTIYFCFTNHIYLRSDVDSKEIAYWVMGFKLTKEIIISNLKYIIIFAMIISFVIICIFYKFTKNLDSSRKKELTVDIVRKIKHEIVRPIAKIESIIDRIINNIENDVKNNIDIYKEKTNLFYSDLYLINLISKSYKLIVRSMFSYVINKENLDNILRKEPIDIEFAIDKSINIAIRSKIIKLDINKKIETFFKNNLLIIDETFLIICLSNILSNAYEAVIRNQLNILTIELNAYYNNKTFFIKIRNYGSYIPKKNYKTVFNAGVSGSILTNSGYGLTILNDIVEVYNGSVNIDSYCDKESIINSWVDITIQFPNISSTNKSELKSLKNTENQDEYKYKTEINILVCDDEIFFIEHFKRIFSMIEDEFVNVTYSLGSDCQMNLILNRTYDLVIMDLKFNNDEEYGYKLIDIIRNKSLDSYVVLHTSTFFEDIKYKHKHLNINEFVQKTITKEKIKDLIINVKNIKSNLVKVEVNEPYYYDEWREINRDCNFHVFTKYDDLFDSVDNNHINLKDVCVLITDYYFDKVEKGLTVLSHNYLETIRKTYDFKGIIILATNGCSLESCYIDGNINKSPKQIKDIIKLYIDRKN